jgi:hypothetical protein
MHYYSTPAGSRKFIPFLLNGLISQTLKGSYNYNTKRMTDDTTSSGSRKFIPFLLNGLINPTLKGSNICRIKWLHNDTTPSGSHKSIPFHFTNNQSLGIQNN